MLPFDRAHSINVFKRVFEIDSFNQPLQTAALLHDVGKGKPRLSHRVALVLAQMIDCFGPPRWHDAPARTFRGSVVSLSNHAEVGAGFLEAAGSDPKVVEIVRGRSPKLMAESELLMTADSQC
jgi:HD superfamily phosphohydrolase